LIRSWISSRGRSIHLEIGDVEIFRRSVRIHEHRWYHICQSWENRDGRYALWLDGHLASQGRSEEVNPVIRLRKFVFKMRNSSTEEFEPSRNETRLSNVDFSHTIFLPCPIHSPYDASRIFVNEIIVSCR